MGGYIIPILLNFFVRHTEKQHFFKIHDSLIENLTGRDGIGRVPNTSHTAITNLWRPQCISLHFSASWQRHRAKFRS
jgi:hypothetical protein